MAIEVKVPPVGESISSGILAAWHVKEGDFVQQDQILFELETDKITSEGLAEAAGKISLKIEEGEEVEIGQVVALIDDTAEASAEPTEVEAEAPSDAPAEESQEPEAEDTEEAEREAEAPSDAPAQKSQEPETEEAEREEEAKTETPKQKKATPISPAVRRIASETGIDPQTVKGTGKGGRVTKGDLLAAAEEDSEDTPAQADSAREPAKSPHVSQPESPSARTTRKKMTSLRKKIADRLVQAQQQAAILTTFNEVDMTEVMTLRKQHQERFVERYDLKLGFMSFFVKAVVKALKDVPGINAQIDGQEIVTNHFYDIGIAVGTERGLVVPVVRDCDQKSFAEIEGAILSYAKKAREGKLTIDDLTGGVFTITNGGIYGSMLSTPIINPPQSGILGMHAIQERPMAVNGEVTIRPMMYTALSYDHRLVDGQEAVTFLVKVKEAIEDPTRLLFEI